MQEVYHMQITRQSTRSRGTNELIVPTAASALDQMKYEIAAEFGVQLGPDTTSRQNGSVGGEMTKRLVRMAEQQIIGRIH
jgi:hypothetical protein